MEEILYQNQSKFTFDEFIDILSKVASIKKKMIISAISSVVLALLVILSWDSNNQLVYIIMCCLVGLGFVMSILMIILDKPLLKKGNKDFEDGVIYNYSFLEKGFEVESVLKSKKMKLTFSYSSLEKVVVNEDAIYIYPTIVSIYCVDLKNFSEDEKNGLIELLKPYCKKK